MKTASPKTSPSSKSRNGIRGALESKAPHKRPFDDYRLFVRQHYDGFPGKLTAFTGVLTGHDSLAGRLFSPAGFDVRGCKCILDAACGNGRYTRFVLRQADRDAMVTAFDYSQGMLRRARHRLKHTRATHVAADITRLPYLDSSFDAIICGWVLEHLPDPRPGLRELARVLKPYGKFLLLTTEDTFLGSVCSRLWHCRTYNRSALKKVCEESGLCWQRELWFTKLHAVARLGGIVVELSRA